MRTFSRIFEKIIAITLIIVLLTGSVSPYAYAADMTDSIYDMAEQDAEIPADMDETVQGSAYLDPEVAEDGTPETGTDLLADVLTTEEMEETLPLNSLTGDWSEDLLQVAQSQEDIPESILNYTEDKDGTVHPYSRYGDWAGIPYGKWDAAFVSFCLHYAGIPEVAFSHYTDISEWVISLMDAGSFLAPGTYEPLPGDLVFLGPAGALDDLTAEEDDDNYNVYIDKDVRVGIVLDTRAVTETDSETGEETEIPVMDVITGDAGDSVYGEYYTPDQLAAMQSEETTEYSDGPDRVRTVTCRTDAEEILGYASLPEEYTKQTMEARIFTDASMETEAEDPADGIRLVGMLPNGGYAAAYPVDAALTNGAKTWLAYEISLFDGSGNGVQPAHGGVILEFYGTTIGRALRESGGLAFYHVITDDDGEEVEEKITAYLENGEEAKKLNISVPEEDGEEDTDDETSGTVFCTAEGFSVYILGSSEAPEEENPKKGPAPAEDETEDKAAASNRKGGGDETPQTRDASDVYNNGMIYISNYSQLAAIGTDARVKSNDRTNFGTGDEIILSGSGTQEDPYFYLTYSNDAVYYLTNDIPLSKTQWTALGYTSRGAWKVPAGFTGMFTSAAACDLQHGIIQDNSVLLINQPAGSYTLYESTGKKVYYYNRYQIEESATDNILDRHFDPLNYTGSNLGSYPYPEYDYDNNYYIAKEFTAQTKFDTTEYINTTDSQGNTVTAIVIRDYAHLKLVGKGVSDVNPSETLNGIEHVRTVNYPSDAVYYLANDIELADDGWQLSADFTGSFTCDKTEPAYGTDKQRLYTRHTASTSRADVYIQNIYQLEIIGQSNDIRSEEPVFDHDYDAAYVGTGSVVYLTNVSTDYLTYNTANTYILSRTFSNERVPLVSSTVLGDLANTDNVDGRDYFGQTTVDIDGTTYILIGDRQQLDVIGKKDTFGNYMEVHGPVYAVTQTRSSILDPWTIDSSRVSLVYPGDADLISGVKMDPAGTQTYDFSTSPLFNDSGSSYHSLGTVRVSSYERVVYCTSDGKGGYNIRANSSGSGSGPQSYAKNANYIVFRDIDMRVHKNEDHGNTVTTPTGQITVMNPGTETYRAYKIFDAETVTNNEETTVKYTIALNSPWLSVVYDTTNNKSNIAGLTFTSTEGGYIVTMGPGFTAKKLASVLKANIPDGATSIAFNADTDSASDLDDGYYLVVANDGTDDQERAMLVTVLAGEEAKIQNKNDMPLDKTVDGVKTEGVQVGQTLHFEINGKVPAVGESDTFYAYYVSDIMDKGLAFDEGSFSVKIYNGGTQFQTYTQDEFYALRSNAQEMGYRTVAERGNEYCYVTFEDEYIPFVLMETDETTGVPTYYALDPEGNKIEVPTYTYDELTVENGGLTEISVPNATLSGDQVRFGENGKTFELSLDMISRREFAGQPIVITYNATVTEDAVAMVEENWAILEYGNNPENFEIKDSKTKVYDSQLIIDKFETDAPERKLAGAKFVLYKDETPNDENDRYYYQEHYKRYTSDEVAELTEGTDYENAGTVQDPIYYVLQNGKRVVTGIEWVTTKANATEVVTDADGRAKFIGLADGTYYNEETEAPVDYVKLAERVEIVVANGDCITPGLSDDEVAMMLTETASINNTIGTNLPSTGGIGTTIFYVLGAILVIAGGVVLVTRRRMSA